MTKSEIRALVKKRRMVTAFASDDDAAALLRNVTAVTAWRNARRPCVYVAMRGEAPTSALLTARFLAGDGVVVPRISNGEMTLHHVNSLDDFSPGAFGILEPPVTASLCAPEDVDCVIVPGVAFDITGGRVGHGKGYYDKFLEKIPAVTRIALAYEWQIFSQVPTEPHDARMHWIVTPASVIACELPFAA